MLSMGDHGHVCRTMENRLLNDRATVEKSWVAGPKATTKEIEKAAHDTNWVPVSRCHSTSHCATQHTPATSPMATPRYSSTVVSRHVIRMATTMGPQPGINRRYLMNLSEQA